MQRYIHAGEPTRFYAANWRGLPFRRSQRAAETLELSDYDYYESTAPAAHHYPALADWPPLRPSGPEPGSHDMGLGFFGTLSDNERRLLLIAAVGLGALIYFRRKPRRRRNPRKRSRTRRRARRR